ncbi:MAG: succinate dehydrogenase, hydrophobic membrane anchor protein [Steroidobacteraceae bacterium]
MSLRSPLGKVLGLGSAKAGAHHWWVQRVSAVGLLLLAPWFLFSLIALGDLSYANVVGWIATPINTVLLSLLVLTVTYHAQLGLQVVVEDYVAAKGTKVVVLLLINFALLVLGVLGVFSVLRIAFGTVTGIA